MSAPALYLSNWRDVVAIWANRRLTQTDTLVRGPGLHELHYLGGRASTWAVNQIHDYNGVFRDESGHHSYTQVGNFDSEAWFESSPDAAGTLLTRYLSYEGASVQPRCSITRHYTAVPNQPFIVARYTLTNTGDTPVDFNVLDQVRLDNVADHDPSAQVHGWHDPQRNALVADMSASGQFFVVLGALQPMDGFQVGDDADTTVTSSSASGLSTFDHDGRLANNGDLHAANVNLAFNKRVTIAPGTTATIDMYLAIRGDLPSALDTADTARGQTADHWFSVTAAAFTAWLSNGGKGKRTQFADAGLDHVFDRSLVFIKNLQNPALGTIVASTNPFAYGYKNWVRDSSIVAIALDASGHFDEAERYWRWMASVQGTDGSWKTTYNFWNGQYISFVEPEFDSVGAFLYGVYRHYRTTGDAIFLQDLWPAVQRAADWLLAHISGANGLGAADFSIWEEPERGLQHNSFTQGWYVVGLYGTQWLAEVRGDTELSDWYAGGAASIMTALQRPSTWQPPGMWNPTGYYNRAVNSDNTPAPLQDTSSDVLIALGVVDTRSGRARSHIGVMTAGMTKNSYGLARYQDDVYYYTSIWDPAGDEVGGPEPSWPQMSMWVAVYESLGNRDAALHRMKWFVSTTGKGYMPQGEAVSNVTQLPVLSSMSEPLTAASYILAALCYRGTFDLRLIPPTYNAGTYKSINVAFGAPADGSQWTNVPYFLANLTPHPKNSVTTVNRVYVTNDDHNLYLRIDNAAGMLPAFAADSKFAIRLYTQDFSGGNASVVRWGIDRQPISRPIAFFVERHSDDNVFRRWTASTQWELADPINVVLPPQWDPTTGRIEMVVPIAALSSGPAPLGSSWATMALTIARADGTPQFATDGNKILIHYRLTSPDQSWTYGNIDT